MTWNVWQCRGNGALENKAQAENVFYFLLPKPNPMNLAYTPEIWRKDPNFGEFAFSKPSFWAFGISIRHFFSRVYLYLYETWNGWCSPSRKNTLMACGQRRFKCYLCGARDSLSYIPNVDVSFFIWKHFLLCCMIWIFCFAWLKCHVQILYIVSPDRDEREYSHIMTCFVSVSYIQSMIFLCMHCTYIHIVHHEDPNYLHVLF